MTQASNHHWMGEALALAAEAAADGDVPVGAVVIVGGRIVGRGRNARERRNDPLAHAEIEAMRDAATALGRWRLDDATVVVTLEPCPMCAGALAQARVGRLVYGAPEPKSGAVRSVFQICDDPRLPHRMEVEAGVREEECAEALRKFFAARRR